MHFNFKENGQQKINTEYKIESIKGTKLLQLCKIESCNIEEQLTLNYSLVTNSEKNNIKPKIVKYLIL